MPKIQTGFFKFVVSPLMVEWHRFLKTDLSYRMMRHLKNNEKQWDSRLQAEIAEETRTEISDAEVLDDEIDDGDDDLRIELSGSPEMVLPEIKCSRRSSLQIPHYSLKDRERRLSVPLHNVPKIILPPREHGARQIDAFLESDEIEALKLDQDSLSLLSSDSESGHRARSSIDSNDPERPLSAENLLPDLNIASMTDGFCADKLNMVMNSGNFPAHFLGISTNKHLIRQQTFPPLQPCYVRTRYMSSTADLGTCPEALLESRSSSSVDSPENENENAPSKKDLKREPEQDFDKACKLPKLSIGPGQKENLDPSTLRKGSLNRRRGSAPVTVALPTRSADAESISAYLMKTSERVRRCSVPAETITLSKSHEIIYRSLKAVPKRAVLTGAKDFVGPSDKSTHSVISSVAPYQRRGSMPCESNIVFRNSVNGKRRNPKKLLRRRSSSGAEILTPMVSETMESTSSNIAESSSVLSRLKKEWTRGDSEALLSRRRGSLPTEVLSIGLGEDRQRDSFGLTRHRILIHESK